MRTVTTKSRLPSTVNSLPEPRPFVAYAHVKHSEMKLSTFAGLVLVAVATASDSQTHSTIECWPSQSVGGGLMAPGGCQTVQHTFHAPHSVGGGMMHGGGWEHKPIPKEDPWRQPIINLFAGFANGYEERQRWNRY